MNYYGARRRGHDLAFHSSNRALRKRPAFLVSINDVPEAWELYSGALHHQAVLGQEQLQVRAAGSAPALDWKKQSCADRIAPGPHAEVLLFHAFCALFGPVTKR